MRHNSIYPSIHLIHLSIGGTPAGQHRPIMLEECMEHLGLDDVDDDGNIGAVDCR